MNKLFFLILLLSLSSLHCSNKKTPQPTSPNILLIISDDQSWTDYSFLGHPHIETPRIDQLATESLTFTRGYVSAPLCRPSLASMASGLYPHQHGITGNDPSFVFSGEGKRYRSEWSQQRKPLQDQMANNFYQHPNLQKLLGEQGYLSLQTGKWWEGSYKKGSFTHGMTHGDPARGGRHGDEGLKIGREGLQTIFDFIDTAQTADQPFFIWYAPFLPHAPHTPPKELEEKYLTKAPTPAVARYWAMCEWFDQSVGELLDHLEEKSLSEETLVVYVCDNGWIQEPDKPNRYAPRSKRSPYEMGIRTPIMYKWPGKITPKMDTTTLASSTDIVPTVLEACGFTSPEFMAGINVLDPMVLEKRSYIFSEAYEHDVQDVNNPTQSLQYRIAINHPWKLLIPDDKNMPDAEIELFNIVEDPHELHNLTKEHPDRVAEMQKVLDEWWKP